MFRGVAGFNIYRDDLDRRVFLSQAEGALNGELLRCLTWSLMDNHGHFGTQTLAGSLSKEMHRLETKYAMYFNKRNERSGHVFQNRFKSLLVEEQQYLLRVVRYVMLNPIEAGIVGSLEELEDYPWTSYPALLGRRRPQLVDVEFTLKLFADPPAVARRELRAWMEAGLREKDPIAALLEAPPGRPTKKLQAELCAAMIGERDSAVVGNDAFIASVLAEARARGAAAPEMAARGWSFESIVVRVCDELGVSLDELRAGRRTAKVSQARSAVAWIGYTRLDLSITEMALSVGVSRQALGKSLSRGERVTRKRLGSLLADLDQAIPDEKVA